MAEPRFEPGQSGWGSTGWGASRGQSGDSFLTGELPGGGGFACPSAHHTCHSTRLWALGSSGRPCRGPEAPVPTARGLQDARVQDSERPTTHGNTELVGAGSTQVADAALTALGTEGPAAQGCGCL